MKKLILSAAVFCAAMFNAQTNEQLKSEIESIKKEIAVLRNDVESVKAHNIYLKKALDINTPVTEVTKDGFTMKITKVAGNKKDKEIAITFLAENKDVNKKTIFDDFELTDLEGNRLGVNYEKTSSPFPTLVQNTPHKMTVVFQNATDTNSIVKAFRFRLKHWKEDEWDTDGRFTRFEFRDLNVNWE